jgi:hypothetical protein
MGLAPDSRSPATRVKARKVVAHKRARKAEPVA